MRRHGKASSAGSNTRRVGRSRLLLGIAAALALTLVLGVTLATATAPVVSVEDAANVEYSTADVKGSVNPEDKETSYHFEYATQAQFEASEWAEASAAGFGSLAGGAGSTSVTEVLGGLAPGTTYHLRLVASNEDGGAEAVAASTFTTKAVATPSVTVDPATAVTGTGAHFTGTVNPGNSAEAFNSSCAFDYVNQANFAAAVEGGFAKAEHVDCDINPVTGAGPVAVQANATNLESHTVYHLRLSATNLGGPTEVEAADTFETLVIAPEVHHTSVSTVSDSEATLNASIDPGGAETTYHFEYLTLAQFEADGESFANAAATPDKGLGASDNADHPATAGVSGLQADTAYRYRALAANSAGTVGGSIHPFHTSATPSAEPDTCPNAAFRTGLSAHLPDCRAYEQVSPVAKNGGGVLGNFQRTRASDSGSAVQFSSTSGFGDVRGVSVTSDYMAVRIGPGHWQTHALNPPQEPATYWENGQDALEPRYVGEFSGDLSAGVFLAKSPLTDAPNVSAAVNIYLRTDLLSPGPGSYTLLSDASEIQDPGGLFSHPHPILAGASTDFSHVIFESTRNLTPDAVLAGLDTASPKLYEWVDGTVRLVGILPADEGGGPTISTAGQGAIARRYTESAISADGSRVVFTAPPYADVEGTLYLRDDRATADPGDDFTVRLSKSERTDCNDDPGCGGDGLPDPEPDPVNPNAPATFWDASADAGKVFFTTAEQMTDDDVNHTADLYRFDLSAAPGHHLTLLSVDHELNDNAGTDVHNGKPISGVLGASEDGAYVYFTVFNGQLVSGGPTGEGSEGMPPVRVFLWHEGELHQVGAVNFGRDTVMMQGEEGWGVFSKTSRVSPDGKHLAFITQGTEELLSLYGLPEYDHGDSCPRFTNLQCSEVYVYDARGNGGGGELQCASCNPTEESATADASFGFLLDDSTSGKDSSHLNHPMSDDGRFVFFNTAESLAEEDINGVLDVYRYDTVAKQVDLISSGTSTRDSAFMDASRDGGDVFFSTRQRLVPSDNDENADLYDARIGGGAAEPPTVAICDPTGGSCQGAATTPPGAASAQSNRVAGGGNSAQHRGSRCHKLKHRVRVKGKSRCVKRKHRDGRAKDDRRASR